MDPPSLTASGGVDDDGGAAGYDATAWRRHRFADPPEVMFELPPVRSSSLPPPSSSSSSSSGRAAVANGGGGGMRGVDYDDYVDEFEMEGLIETFDREVRGRPPTRSSTAGVPVGGGGFVAALSTLRRLVPSKLGGSSRISLDGIREGAADGALARRCSYLAAMCSLALEPRNRSRSAIALLFVSLLFTAILTENDVAAWHRSIFGRISGKKGAKGDPSLVGLTDDQRQWLLKSLYGSYTFYDGSAEDRPTVPYMTAENANNTYLDLPEDKFPMESWQADAVYANHFLDAAEKLVKRGQQAIFATYHGLGLSDVRVTTDEGGGERVDYVREDAEQRSSRRSKMFHMEEIDLVAVTSADLLRSAAPSWERKGGWTTERSFNGLERRLIHAMMTRSESHNGNFTVVFTGSWQSMGYGGNHAWQSTAGVFETLLKGVFEKLGVNLVVRAIGLPPLSHLSAEEQTELIGGGKSTLLHTLGWSSIYGSDVDMVVWDDYGAVDDGGSVRVSDELSTQLFDLFARQALLSGNTSLPFIWGGDFEVLRYLHNYVDADVGQLGNALAGVPETTSEIAASDLPWPAQFLNCPTNMQDTCEKEEYQFESRCWVERSDITPPTPQLDHIPIMPSAIGWKMQKLKGFTLAYVLLTATLDALFEWSEITISQGFPLPDEHWHIGEYIKNVQDKVKSLDESVAPHCFKLEKSMNLPRRLCTHKMSGRTEYTPRAYPLTTSIRSLIHIDHVSETKPSLLYDGEDVVNPFSEIPRGEVDALEIFGLQGKRRLRQRFLSSKNVTGTTATDVIHRRRTDAITPGEGWRLLHSYGDGCDGSLSSSNTCGRLSSSNCLLEGHQGSRGGIWGNETTGWLVLRGIKPENGFIALNLDFGRRNQTRREWHESLPESFMLECVTGGKNKRLDKAKFADIIKQPPGMSLLVILDEQKSGEATDVEVAVRVLGCGDHASCQFALTHVYWS